MRLPHGAFDAEIAADVMAALRLIGLLKGIAARDGKAMLQRVWMRLHADLPIPQ